MQTIKKLKSRGWTKWAISKRLGVSWHTVYHWERKTFKPTLYHLTMLKSLLLDPQKLAILDADIKFANTKKDYVKQLRQFQEKIEKQKAKS